MDGEPLEVDYSMFEDVLWPSLAHRVPAFEALKVSQCVLTTCYLSPIQTVHNSTLFPHTAAKCMGWLL